MSVPRLALAEAATDPVRRQEWKLVRRLVVANHSIIWPVLRIASKFDHKCETVLLFYLKIGKPVPQGSNPGPQSGIRGWGQHDPRDQWFSIFSPVVVEQDGRVLLHLTISPASIFSCCAKDGGNTTVANILHTKPASYI